MKRVPSWTLNRNGTRFSHIITETLINKKKNSQKCHVDIVTRHHRYLHRLPEKETRRKAGANCENEKNGNRNSRVGFKVTLSSGTAAVAAG